MLYIVSTPIGNLKDITYRAVEVLKAVDIIAAEDTRHSKKLLNAYDIDTPLTSYFDHSKKSKLDAIINKMREGQDVALVSDAGTPGINDPGYKLINAAYDNDIEVTVVPGATAVISALSLSGLPTDRFTFEGFFPVKSGGRRRRLEALKDEERTIVFYESPYRIVKALKDIEEVLGDPVVCVVREITKKFEEVKKDKASVVFDYFSQKKPKGEFVVVFNLRIER
ncbi:MAG: 16S rRNA (cytidine1402-2'-O)-methyltransferase [Candidatus Omnitrophota bacterium]|jgi:16S rRNA (cytidine1402-2'-O)-methyltransferase